MSTFRAARPGDYSDYARLFPELEVPDPVPTAERWWEKQGERTLIAEEGGQVRGYLWDELIGSTLYIRHVVTDPGFRRGGVAKRLIAASQARARAASAQRWCLNVKDDNVAAITLYESLGLKPAYVTLVLRMSWARVPAPETDALAVREPAADDAPRVEVALGLLAGQVAHQRGIGRVLVAAFDAGGAPVGFAAFDPTFPGAYPFRARDVSAAGALLKGMAPHRVAFGSGDWRDVSVQLVVEENEPLGEALERIGAERVLRILHLAAPL